MYEALPLTLAALIAGAVVFIGSIYLIAPERMTGSFGLRLPAPDADTGWWLRLKGIRDVGAGLAVLTLMVIGERHSLAVVLLVFAVIPLGDMSIVLASGGSRAKALSIHGVTCVVMLVAGLLLLHGA